MTRDQRKKESMLKERMMQLDRYLRFEARLMMAHERRAAILTSRLDNETVKVLFLLLCDREQLGRVRLTIEGLKREIERLEMRPTPEG